jgi:hypothetical protein
MVQVRLSCESYLPRRKELAKVSDIEPEEYDRLWKERLRLRCQSLYCG